jgi:hypothetical protein
MITIGTWVDVGCFLSKNLPFSAVLNPEPDTTEIRPKHDPNMGQRLAPEKGRFGAVLWD